MVGRRVAGLVKSCAGSERTYTYEAESLWVF
jgi:hypothetical protein